MADQPEKRRNKDGTYSWRVRWRQDGKRESETFPNRADAAAFKTLVEASHNRWPERIVNGHTEHWIPGQGWPPSNPNPSGHTVRSAALHAIDLNIEANPGTKAEDRRKMDRYLPESDPLAGIFVEDVTAEDIKAWHARLAETTVKLGGLPRKKRRGPNAAKLAQPPTRKLSPKTRMGAHSLVSAGLNLMVELGKIPRNVAYRQGPKRAKPPKKTRTLTPAEFLALWNRIPGPYKPFVNALGRTGMRFSEATALTRSKVMLSAAPFIIVDEAHKRGERYSDSHVGPTKSGASGQGQRTVPIDKALATTLAPLVKERKPHDLVFQTVTGKKIRHSNFLTRIWNPAVEAAYEAGEISFMPTPHDLRHAHASWLLASGVPVMTVADRLGHDPKVLLDTYSHLFDAARAQAAAVIGDVLSGRATTL